MNISEVSKFNTNNSLTSQSDSTTQVDNSDVQGSFKDFLKEKPDADNKNEDTSAQTNNTENFKTDKTDKTTEKNKLDEKDEKKDKSAEMNVIHINLARTNAELLNITKKQLNEKNIKAKSLDTYRLDISKMNKNDVEFLKQIVDKKDIAFSAISSQNNQIEIKTAEEGVGKVYKTLDVSKTVFDVVDKAFNTQKPVRLDFDNNSSVILKIDKDGKLSAEFMSSDKAMAQALQSNIPLLKNSFDVQNLPYKEISYRNPNRGQNQQNQNNKNKNNGG